MKWMKFTDFEGDTIWLNMALAMQFYPSDYKDTQGTFRPGTRITFGDDNGVTVKDTPEEIIARGEWLVK